MRLTDEAMLQLLGSSTAPAAYALSFSKDRQQEFLEEKEVRSEFVSASVLDSCSFSLPLM